MIRLTLLSEELTKEEGSKWTGIPKGKHNVIVLLH